MQDLPLGIQTFEKIRNENRLYVDKTAMAQQLIENYNYVFLSRPHRFGKSLFLSTLQDLFEGRKELFTGLAIENTYDWSQSYPVIRLDMSGNTHTLDDFHNVVFSVLKDNQKRLGLSDCESPTPSVFLHNLITHAHEKYGQKVVILIDEYDKPLLNAITDPELSNALRDLLQNFYINVKRNDHLIRFGFFTGVTKFSKMSVFSGINNLMDISLDSDYATICGYTQRDLETTFAEHLQGVDWAQLREWYNGYQFNGEPVYNPFDILKFIATKRKYSNHWFETGTPSFLIKQLQAKQYYLPSVENLVISESALNAYDTDKISIEALLFQAGYLTIDREEASPLGIFYHLRLPNKEVRISLSECLIDAITEPETPTFNSRNALYQALQNADMDSVRETLTAIFASIPYHIYSNSPLSHYEGYYSVVMYSYLLSLGVNIQLERSTNKGRLDMVVDIADKRYLMEFKMDGKGDALAQIKEKQYFQAFYDTEREIYLIGIDFSEEERNLSAFAWEKYAHIKHNTNNTKHKTWKK